VAGLRRESDQPALSRPPRAATRRGSWSNRRPGWAPPRRRRVRTCV